MEHAGYLAEFADSATAAFLYNAILAVVVVVVATGILSVLAIVLLENTPGFARDMKQWINKGRTDQ